MIHHDALSGIAIYPTDIIFQEIEGGRHQITAGDRNYVIQTDTENARMLDNAINTVLPRLRADAPMREQLSLSEMDMLTPCIDQLKAIGVLLFPSREAADRIHTAEDVKIYTFCARQASDADAAFVGLKSQQIVLCSPNYLAENLLKPLQRQGFDVQCHADAPTAVAAAASGAAADVVVLAASTSAWRLESMNAIFVRNHMRWVPVVYSPTIVQIGPWTAPGQTACLSCMGRTNAEEPISESAFWNGAVASWLSLQPGALTWIAGLIAHLALHATVPFGEGHPWGRVTRVNVASWSQETFPVWRDPYCRVCAKSMPAIQEWVTP